MTKKKSTKNEDDFDESIDDAFDEYEEIEFKKTSQRRSLNARRRHEQLKEDRKLEKLLSNDFDYLDDFEEYEFFSE
ncbi:MAG: hypothetical protein OEZ38_14930, partial [Gammaproteobacteria bacterium]|nr:hypothetical protein [Gammaproteobacteria bacterium]